MVLLDDLFTASGAEVLDSNVAWRPMEGRPVLSNSGADRCLHRCLSRLVRSMIHALPAVATKQKMGNKQF